MQIEQPSSGTWLKPAEINGHLILVSRVHRVEMRFDQLAGRDKEFAEFTMVDLDASDPHWETVLDSHPGIIGKVRNIAPGSAVLGRISQVPGSKASPAWVLTEYTPGIDDVRAQQFLNSAAGQAAQPVPAQPMANTAPAYRYPQGAAPPMTGVAGGAPPATETKVDEVEALRKQLAALQNANQQ